jgi:sterol desaturase/sphingolipid hydroxylase (fatty acid hydroxylase superfamily)
MLSRPGSHAWRGPPGNQPNMTAETVLRLVAFLAMLAAMGALEAILPRRARTLPRLARWPHNLGLVAINGVALRLIVPGGATAGALWAEANGLGLLRQIDTAPWLAFAVAVVLLDLAVYAQHVAFHAVPALWRLHRVHHADRDVDVTTGVRFHPIEMVVSLALRLAVVALLGAPPAAVLAFEILLNLSSMFNHANLRVAPAFEPALRWLIVTPDMHRVHHSIVRLETDSNFGFNLPWWDRVFGTYRGQPAAGHDAMTLGLPQFREPGEQRLDRLLTQPFRRAGIARQSHKVTP